MKLWPILTLALLVGPAACGDTPPPEDAEGEPAGEAEARAAAADPAPITGYLTLEGQPIITRCGTGEELPVDGPALPDLLDLHTSLAPGMEPMEGVFVDVLGTIRDSGGGPEVDALEVRRAAWEGGGCGDGGPPPVYSASGTEPFWSLTVTDETLTWSTPEGGTTMEHQGPYRMNLGGWQVDGTSAAGGELTARFYPEPCQNAMSGAWFHMRAGVELDGTSYEGCAWSGR
ncbi:MAG TPA: hypothetical protein VK858_16705 [Longimicrobiales bacterium]|nr:hypothetical protein [Longimicrobiales bacterium]